MPPGASPSPMSLPLATLDLAPGIPAAERQRLDALLEAVPLAVALFDGALTLVATNARYRDLTGLDMAQASGRPIYDAFPNALRPKISLDRQDCSYQHAEKPD